MTVNQSSKFNFEQNCNVGPWNEEESLKYIIFLDENKIVMASKHKKKKYRVFDQMSQFLKTRTSLQCRSHHQKAIEKYKDVKDIILHQKKQLSTTNYKLKFKELKDHATVKEKFEIIEKIDNIKQKQHKNEQQKLMNQVQYSYENHPIYPSYIGLIPTQIYSVMPMNNSHLAQNYYFYINFPTN